jgi:hypothetical protein
MDIETAITVYLTSALVAALLATLVARMKRRHSGYWMLFCFLFPPLILLLLILPKGRTVHDLNRDPFTDDEESDSLIHRD